MSKISFLIIETKDHDTSLYEEFYRDAFKKLGYEIDISVTSNQVDDDIYSYDVLVCDLSLGKTDSYAGFQIIKKIKKVNPNIFVIAHSRTNVTFAESSSHIPSFDCFVYKPRMHDSAYKDYITSQISCTFKKNIYLNDISCEFANSKLFRKKEAQKQLNEILKEITFTSHMSDKYTSIEKVRLEPLYGGYGVSEVFRLFAYTHGGLGCINAVLKISKKESYYREKNNYLKFVKWYLPYTWRPELIGFSESRDFGALCYSFIYNDEVKFISLTESLRSKRLDKLQMVIDSVFDPNHARWYSPNNFHDEGNIVQYYYKRWFDGRKMDEVAVCETVRKNGGVVFDNKIVIDEIEYEKPASSLLGNTTDGYISCVRHGDLNTNNILISEDNSISFIDFEDTGKGHVFEDFVTLEGCVRLNYRMNKDITQLINDEYDLATTYVEKQIDQFRSDNKMIETLSSLRMRALETCNDEPPVNYIYALSLYCFRLMRLPDLEEWQKSQLVSCLLANMRVIKLANE